MKISSTAVAVLGFLLIIVIVFRNPQLADYEEYVQAYFYGSDRFEAAWGIFRVMTLPFRTPKAIFFIFGAISVVLTITAIKKESRFPLFSTLIWISYTFIIQEMIEIRQAVAGAIFLYSIRYINTNDMARYMVLNLIGSLFHISALILIPLYFIKYINWNKWIFMSLIPIAYIVYFGNLGLVLLIQHFPNEYVQNLLLLKIETIKNTSDISMFNGRIIINQFLCLFLWYRIERIERIWKKSVVYIKIYTLSIVIFVLFFNIPDIAMRLNILLSVPEIIAIPAFIITFKDRAWSKLCVSGIALIFFINYFRNYILV